jgi:hypothetical protein
MGCSGAAKGASMPVNRPGLIAARIRFFVWRSAASKESARETPLHHWQLLWRRELPDAHREQVDSNWQNRQDAFSTTPRKEL